MDIEILLWLQNLREETRNVFTPFMELMSGTMPLLLLPVFVYWCISKRGGLLLMLSLYLSCFVGYMLKLTFCVARPFVRDPRLVPVHRSSSYSFPSGHAIRAASVCGGLAVLTRLSGKT